MEADAAWEGLEITGDGETIVITDTGVDYTHEMLSGKVIDGACFSTNDAGNDISSLCPNGQEAIQHPACLPLDSYTKSVKGTSQCALNGYSSVEWLTFPAQLSTWTNLLS